jgi:DNA-binding NarL/FixJ family response regulator
MLRMRLSEAFSDIPGVEVIGEAESKKEAVELIQKVKPDVVILDIRLRVGHGIDVIHEIKKDENPPVIIMFTGYPYPHFKKRCEDEGADYFFNKDADFDELLGLVTELAKQKSGK